MRFGPQTGARDGNKDYKEMSNLRGRDTGSRYKDEERKAKEQAKRERHAEKMARKKGYGL